MVAVGDRLYVASRNDPPWSYSTCARPSRRRRVPVKLNPYALATDGRSVWVTGLGGEQRSRGSPRAPSISAVIVVAVLAAGARAGDRRRRDPSARAGRGGRRRWRPSGPGSQPKARACAHSSEQRSASRGARARTASWSKPREDWIWVVDEHGMLTYSNAAGCRAAGPRRPRRPHARGAHAPRRPRRRAGRRSSAAGTPTAAGGPSTRAPCAPATAGRGSIATSAPRRPHRARGWSARRASRSCAGRSSTAAARSSPTSWSATAACSTTSRPPSCSSSAAGRPVWVSARRRRRRRSSSREGAGAAARGRQRDRAGAGAGRRRASRSRSTASTGDSAAARALRDRQGRASSGRDDDELRALIAEPAERGLVLVATGVADADEFTRCRVLGFSHFQGEFFARPRGEERRPARRASPRCRRSAS